MSAQICPKCNERKFFWSDDPEISPDTLWNCLECGYFATEDERLVKTCEKCRREHASSVLNDGFQIYRICFSCRDIVELRAAQGSGQATDE